MYRDVTLAPDDIEWERPERSQASLAIFSDRAFNAYVEEHGVDASLEKFTYIHRQIANQLISRAVDKDTPLGWWESRAIHAVHRAKKRRQQLRAMLRRRDGDVAAERVIAALTIRNPRAEWGAETDES